MGQGGSNTTYAGAICQPICHPKRSGTVLCKYKSSGSNCPSTPCGCDIGFLNDNGSPKEVDRDQHVPMDYSFLGSAWAEAEELPKKLFNQGGLVAFHGLEIAQKEESMLARAYEIRPRPLGWGTFGEVLAARHHKTGAKRAIKSVSKARLGTQVKNPREYVRHEASILKSLDHPNIVRLHEVYEDAANLYLVMELCEGGNLSSRLRSDNELLTEPEASGVLCQVLSAVRHMHARGLVHRDLKMENVVLSNNVDRPWTVAPLVKLTDFGLAVKLNVKGCMRITEVAGTLDYMAPEALVGKVDVPFADRTDMWSLGVLHYKMLTGHIPPQEGAKMPEASTWAQDLLEQLLQIPPELRPTAAAAARHTFFDASQQCCQQAVMEAAPAVNAAIGAFASTSRLRRLALVATARATDDSQLVSSIREIFEVVELECDGIASRQALERAAQAKCPTSGTSGCQVVQALVRAFEFVDTDGSGSMDWTEFLAVILGMSTCAKTIPQEGKSSAGGSFFDEMLQQEACRHAFDLLSQSSGLISALTLGSLLVHSSDAKHLFGKVPSRVNAVPKGLPGGVSMRQTRSPPPRSPPISVRSPALPVRESVIGDRSLTELDSMIRELSTSGVVNAKAFAELLGLPSATPMDTPVASPRGGSPNGSPLASPREIMQRTPEDPDEVPMKATGDDAAAATSAWAAQQVPLPADTVAAAAAAAVADAVAEGPTATAVPEEGDYRPVEPKPEEPPPSPDEIFAPRSETPGLAFPAPTPRAAVILQAPEATPRAPVFTPASREAPEATPRAPVATPASREAPEATPRVAPTPREAPDLEVAPRSVPRAPRSRGASRGPPKAAAPKAEEPTPAKAEEAPRPAAVAPEVAPEDVSPPLAPRGPRPRHAPGVTPKAEEPAPAKVEEAPRAEPRPEEVAAAVAAALPKVLAESMPARAFDGGANASLPPAAHIEPFVPDTPPAPLSQPLPRRRSSLSEAAVAPSEPPPGPSEKKPLPDWPPLGVQAIPPPAPRAKRRAGSSRRARPSPRVRESWEEPGSNWGMRRADAYDGRAN